MRRISAWVGLIAAPTLVAGIYGMNFDNMPELHWLYGYPLALVLMAAQLAGGLRDQQARRLAVTARQARAGDQVAGHRSSRPSTVTAQHAPGRCTNGVIECVGDELQQPRDRGVPDDEATRPWPRPSGPQP